MGGHGHEEGHGGNGEDHGDHDLVYKIQPIYMVQHNPNVFWSNPLHFGTSYEILGGHSTAFCAGFGAFIAKTYFNFQTRYNPPTFYRGIVMSWGRIFFGAAIGGWLGYLRFGDRQRLHNVYTADRIYRRYKESKNIKTTGLKNLRDHEPHEAYYKWK